MVAHFFELIADAEAVICLRSDIIIIYNLSELRQPSLPQTQYCTLISRRNDDGNQKRRSKTEYNLYFIVVRQSTTKWWM
jgi:hypothetical protein